METLSFHQNSQAAFKGSREQDLKKEVKDNGEGERG